MTESVRALLLDKEYGRMFSYFNDIAAIPRPSHQEKAVSDYLVEFAKKYDLEYYQDEMYNVIIIREASEGRENDDPIILQGHMGMVCEKNPKCAKDMNRDGLDIDVDGDFIYAKGTSLGADDGVAIMIALAILSDDRLSHPRLEFVCTTCEEVGVEGANFMDVSPLKGRKLINLDNEIEGEFLAGCAGGGVNTLTIDLKPKNQYFGKAVAIELAGLKGGHSGADIDKDRGNAMYMMAGVLKELIDEGYRIHLGNFRGGSKSNAIPRSCIVNMMLSADRMEGLKPISEILYGMQERLHEKWGDREPEAEILWRSSTETTDIAYSFESSKKVVDLLLAEPNGVCEMNEFIPGLVETSLNLGITELSNNTFKAVYSMRSGNVKSFDELLERMNTIADEIGAEHVLSGRYSPWEYVNESSFRDNLVALYEDMFAKKPRVCTIHAGVECGCFSKKMPGLDCVSIGPDIYDIHSPNERLSISSTKRMYDFVKKAVETC